MKRPLITTRRAGFQNGLVITLFLSLWSCVATFTLLADEPVKFLVNEADAFRKRALEEIRKAQPDVDVPKLVPDGFSYQCAKLSNGMMDQETLRIKFIDPTREKPMDTGVRRSIMTNYVVVDFTRNLLNESAIRVQVRTGVTHSFPANSATPVPSVSFAPLPTPSR